MPPIRVCPEPPAAEKHADASDLRGARRSILGAVPVPTVVPPIAAQEGPPGPALGHPTGAAARARGQRPTVADAGSPAIEETRDGRADAEPSQLAEPAAATGTYESLLTFEPSPRAEPKRERPPTPSTVVPAAKHPRADPDARGIGEESHGRRSFAKRVSDATTSKFWLPDEGLAWELGYMDGGRVTIAAAVGQMLEDINSERQSSRTTSAWVGTTRLYREKQGRRSELSFIVPMLPKRQQQPRERDERASVRPPAKVHMLITQLLLKKEHLATLALLLEDAAADAMDDDAITWLLKRAAKGANAADLQALLVDAECDDRLHFTACVADYVRRLEQLVLRPLHKELHGVRLGSCVPLPEPPRSSEMASQASVVTDDTAAQASVAVVTRATSTMMMDALPLATLCDAETQTHASGPTRLSAQEFVGIVAADLAQYKRWFSYPEVQESADYLTGHVWVSELQTQLGGSVKLLLSGCAGLLDWEVLEKEFQQLRVRGHTQYEYPLLVDACVIYSVEVMVSLRDDMRPGNRSRRLPPLLNCMAVTTDAEVVSQDFTELRHALRLGRGVDQTVANRRIVDAIHRKEMVQQLDAAIESNRGSDVASVSIDNHDTKNGGSGYDRGFTDLHGTSVEQQMNPALRQMRLPHANLQQARAAVSLSPAELREKIVNEETTPRFADAKRLFGAFMVDAAIDNLSHPVDQRLPETSLIMARLVVEGDDFGGATEVTQFPLDAERQMSNAEHIVDAVASTAERLKIGQVGYPKLLCVQMDNGIFNKDEKRRHVEDVLIASNELSDVKLCTSTFACYDPGHYMWWSEVEMCVKWRHWNLQDALTSLMTRGDASAHTKTDIGKMFDGKMNSSKRARQRHYLAVGCAELRANVAQFLKSPLGREFVVPAAEFVSSRGDVHRLSRKEIKAQVRLRELEAYDAWLAWREQQMENDDVNVIHNRFIDDFLAMERMRMGTRVPWVDLMHSGAIECWRSLMVGSNYQGSKKKGHVNYSFDTCHFYRRYFSLPEEWQKAIDCTMVASMTGESMHWLGAEEMSEMTVRSAKSAFRGAQSAAEIFKQADAALGRHKVMQSIMSELGCRDSSLTERDRRKRDEAQARKVAKRIEACMSTTLASAWKRARAVPETPQFIF